MASVTSDSTVTFLEQKPRWSLVPRGQAVTLRCILKNSQYPWMGWYQQDLQQQLQWLVTLRTTGDKEVKSVPGADYLATRVTDTELRLQVSNMTQGRTLYCTCSTDTVISRRSSACHGDLPHAGAGRLTQAPEPWPWN
ncbi:T-cell receptor beta chain variable region [Sigmodon hispidus]